jgi:predicted small lipoprotein YifL
MPYPLTLLLIVLTIAPLAGCGQTGPLYMPTEEAPHPPAAPVDASTPHKAP